MEEVDNSKIIDLVMSFKKLIQKEIFEKEHHSQDMKAILWKTLIMAEISHRSFFFKDSY